MEDSTLGNHYKGQSKFILWASSCFPIPDPQLNPLTLMNSLFWFTAQTFPSPSPALFLSIALNFFILHFTCSFAFSFFLFSCHQKVNSVKARNICILFIAKPHCPHSNWTLHVLNQYTQNRKQSSHIGLS